MAEKGLDGLVWPGPQQMLACAHEYRQSGLVPCGWCWLNLAQIQQDQDQHAAEWQPVHQWDSKEGPGACLTTSSPYDIAGSWGQTCPCAPSPQGTRMTLQLTAREMKVWINNYICYKVLNLITCPFLYFNGAANEVWERISNFITFTGHCGWLLIHGGIKSYPCK